MASRILFPAALVLTLGGFAACAASDTTTQATTSNPTEQACVPGHQTVCPCFGGTQGLQICLEDGSGFGSCDCSGEVTTTTSSSSGEPPPPCGNGVCADDENCHTCEIDCGMCEPCTLAPKCDNAFVPKPNLAHMDTLDIKKMTRLSKADLQARLEKALAKAGPELRVLAAALDAKVEPGEHPLVPALRKVFAENASAAERLRGGLAKAGWGSAAAYRAKFPLSKIELPKAPVGDADPPGGTVECGAPLLRVGVQKMKVHEKDDVWPAGGDEIFCIIQSESATGAEVRLLPMTPSLENGKEFAYSLESGVIWGQKGPTTPGGNLMITYDCVEQDDSSTYQKLIDAVGNAAGQIGGVIPGDSGWILTTVGALAPVISGSLGLNGDDHLFNASQVLPLDIQLELTNGRFWSIRKGDDGNFADGGWDWELFVQAWGCAEYGTL